MAIDKALLILEFQHSQFKEQAPDIVEYLKSARGDVEYIMSLISDLLLIGQLGQKSIALELNVCDVRTLIDKALASIAALTLAKSIQIEKDVVPGAIRADESKILQVLINLITNAIKYSHCSRSSMPVTGISFLHGRRTTISISTLISGV